MVDPTGEYVCGSGVTQSMCDYFQNELDAAQKGPNALKDKYGADSTQYTDVQRATEGVGLRLPKCREEGGFTLLELIVAAAILSILTMMALPWRASRFSASGRRNYTRRCGRCVTPLTATKIRPNGALFR